MINFFFLFSKSRRSVRRKISVKEKKEIRKGFENFRINIFQKSLIGKKWTLETV